MPDPRSSDDRCDVSLIVATTAPPNPAIDGKELLQHVSLQHYNPLEQTNRPSKLTLFPGEYLTNLSGQRDSERIYSLAFETSLGRTLTVGSTHWRGEHIWFTAPHGHELRSFEIMTDRFDGIINVRPHFVPRKRVVAHYGEPWAKIAEKINRKAKKRIELPRNEVDPFVVLMNDTITRLAALDEREVLSVSALAATFDDLLKRSLDEVFSRKSLVVRALTLRVGMSQRLLNLSKLLETLRRLSWQLSSRFEATERQFLTVPYVSDGTDIVPFVLRFVRQEITSHNCGTAITVFQNNVRMMTQFRLDYVSRLMYYLLRAGDLTRLRVVVVAQAKHDNQTLAQVFKAWEHCVPAIRLAIKYRHVDVLKWLLFEVCLFPEDKEPPVQLDGDSPDRFWSIDELLTQREHERGAECETLRHCHQFVGRVRRARDFHVLTQQLLDPKRSPDVVAASSVESLVPLITHAFDLKWIFTFVDMYNIPDAQAKPLFAKAFRHVLHYKLVLDLPSAIFFHKTFKHAKQQGFVTQAVADELEVLFPRVHVEGADWALELQHHVRQTMHKLDSTQERLASLKDAFTELKTSIAQHELTEEERRCRKQLLSLFASLLPLVAPPFAILEQCISLCDPLPLVIAIVENNGESVALDKERFLSPNAPAGGGLTLQQGLAEALNDVHIRADELLDLLRDAVRDNNDDDNRPRRDSEGVDEQAQRPRGNSARRRMSFREAVAMYMEQRRELELAVQTSFRTRGEGTKSEHEPALSEEEPAAAAPTWRWYNMLPSVRRFFMAP